MRYPEMGDVLYDRFPELRCDIEKCNEYWKYERAPMDILFSETLCIRLHGWLQGNKSDAVLRRAFDLLEAMAMCDDTNIQNLLQVTILESLWSDAYVLKRAESLMGEYTKAFNACVGEYLRRP